MMKKAQPVDRTKGEIAKALEAETVSFFRQAAEFKALEQERNKALQDLAAAEVVHGVLLDMANDRAFRASEAHVATMQKLIDAKAALEKIDSAELATLISMCKPDSDVYDVLVAIQRIARKALKEII